MSEKAYIPQPGTIPAKAIAYLQEQADVYGRRWISQAELEASIGQEGLSPYLLVPVARGALIKRRIASDKRLTEYALGDGTPERRPDDLEPDEPLNAVPKLPVIPAVPATPWSGLATPPADTRPKSVIAAEKAWATGKQQNHRGKIPEWGIRSGLPPIQAIPTKGAPTVSKRKMTTTPEYVDIESMQITDDPVTGNTNSGGDKYSALFSNLKLGQAIKCRSADAPKVGNALRKWRDERFPGAQVRAVSRYPKDGLGRVWLLPAAEKAKKAA